MKPLSIGTLEILKKNKIEVQKQLIISYWMTHYKDWLLNRKKPRVGYMGPDPKNIKRARVYVSWEVDTTTADNSITYSLIMEKINNHWLIVNYEVSGW